jgi:hypothetical protein
MDIFGWLRRRPKGRRRSPPGNAAHFHNEALRSHGWAVWKEEPNELSLVEVRSDESQHRYFFVTETDIVYNGHSGKGFTRRDLYALLTKGRLVTDQTIVDLVSQRSLVAADHLGRRLKPTS